MKPCLPGKGLAALAVLSLVQTGPLPASLTTNNLLYYWDASDATTATPASWTSRQGSQAGNNDVWTVQSFVNQVAATSVSAGITSAYQTGSWAPDSLAGSLTRAAFTPATSAITSESVSYEFWVKPDSLTDGRSVIFETGGSTRGHQLTLDDDDVFVSVKTSDPASTLAPAADQIVTHTLSPGDENDFIQIVVTIDGINDTIGLYVNPVSEVAPGTAKATTTWTTGDQPFGTSAASLGGINSGVSGTGEIGGGGNTTAPWRVVDYFGFLGEYAIMRVYDSVLTGGEVADNFEATLNGPAIVTNEPLSVAANSTGTPVTDETHLFTDDRDTAAAGLTYTLTSLPAAGTLNINGSAAVLGSNDTFTQDDLNNDLLSFDAGTAASIGDSFTFDVSDGTSSVSGAFTINVAVAGAAVADSFSGDEDSVATDLGLANLLDNDTGDPITLVEVNGDPAGVGAEVVTTAGGRVTVNADGSFSYDPTGSAALQDGGGADSFTYTIEDFFGGTSTETVSLTVTSVNDVPQATNDLLVGSVFEDGVLASTASLVANDGIVRTDAGLNDILSFNLDARYGAGAAVWENRGSEGGAQADALLGSGVTLDASPGSAFAQITAAYKFDGTVDATAELRGGSPETINGSDDISTTFEVWVKLDPADLNQDTTLFESGGGSGVGIVVDFFGVLQVALDSGASPISYDLIADPLDVINPGNQNGDADLTAEFLQVVLALDLDADVNTLFVNGVEVGTAANTLNDWSGSDGAGLGHFAGVNHGGFANPAAGTIYDTHLNGHLFAFRQYDGALSRNQVVQNFVAVASGTDLDGETISASGILDGALVSQGIGSPATLASGAIVTLDNSTGAFTYDPNGAYDDLVAGDSAVDSFTYGITDGSGGTAQGVVTLTINGRNDAVDDTLAVRELEVTTFRASAVVGNDEHTLATPTPFVELDALNASGGVIPNTGTGGATYDATIVGGTVQTQPAMQSNFGALGAAIQDPAVTLASLQPISLGDASFELWFRPETGTTGRQVLFESGGGGNGSSIVYDADRDEVVVKVDAGSDGNASTQITAATSGIAKDEFNQLVVVYDRDNPGNEDSLTLYLNNDPGGFDPFATVVTNTLGGANDWSGTDASGIGTVNGSVANSQILGDFVGEIAILRVYNRALSPAEVEANYDVENDPIVSLPPGSPVTTGLNATVTLNPDGSFTYDATGLNVDVPNGAVQQDTFTYTISDGTGGSTTATVTVDITGVDNGFYAVDDTFTIGEDDGPMSFDPLANDVGAGSATIEFPVVVDSASAALAMNGTVVGEAADFTSGGSGWQFLWNAPSDWDGTSSLTAVDGALGGVADYELLTWSGTMWRPDGDDDTATGDPGGFLRINSSGGHPGLGSGQTGTTPADNAVDRAAILAYTVPATDIYGIANSSLTRVETGGATISANVYVGTTLIDVVTCGPAQTVDFDLNLGNVTAGETIYVAISPDGAAGNDSFLIDFDVVTLPSLDTPVDDLTGFSTDGSTITFDPAMGFESLALGGSTTRTISYTIVDGPNTSVGTFTVTINGANDAPVANGESATTNEDAILAGNVLANDTDPDQGDDLSLVTASVEGSGGNVGVPVLTALGATITINADGSFSYDPNGALGLQAMRPGQSMVDTVTYEVADQHGLLAAAPADLTITVTGTEDGVIATDDAFTVAPGGMVSGNLITDDNGNGIDSSIDTGDGLAILEVDTTGLQGSLTIGLPNVIAARGTVDLTDDIPVSVNFGAGVFTNPVVIVGPVGNAEAESCVAHVTSVNPAGGFFNVQLKEQPETGAAASDADSAAHATETLSWLVIEAGQYQLPNGALVEAGTVTTAATQESAAPDTWEAVTFASSFTQVPVVLTSLNSINPLAMAGETLELMGTRQQNTTTSGFEVAMEDHEGDVTPRTTTEVIGWLAIEPGLGGWSGHPFEVDTTPDAVTEAFFTIDFWRPFGSTPNNFAKMARIDGVDPSHLRYQSLDGDSVQVKVGEDRYSDTELTHTPEIVGYLVVGGTGDLTAYDQGTVQGAFTYDASGATGTQTFTYTLTDSLGFSDTATVTITIGGGGDTDSDGIPDSFEDVTPGLDSNNPNDALEDQDGDGATAIWEYGMGTDLNDPNDTPIFVVERFDATQNRITLGPITAGRTYLLYEGDTAPLLQVDSFTAGADAATHEFFRDRNLPAALYKAEVELPLP